MNLASIRLSLFSLLILLCLVSHGEDIAFPPEAGVRNVCRDFGAKGDGVTDDTAAFQAAYKETGLLYVPNGTYLISDSIVAPDRKGSASCRRILQGQSTEKTILKLKDGAKGFGDPRKPKPLWKVTWDVKIAQAFRNGVRNITFDTGKGNPGAVALDYFASNQGGMHSVVLRSGDRAGVCGLRMDGDNGPLLVKNLLVEGFDVGIEAAANHLATMEHITLKNQNVCGMKVTNKTIIRNLVSQNEVPAIDARTPQIILLDARLTGGKGVAMSLSARMALVRNLTVEGYATALKTKSEEIPGPHIAEWSSRPADSLFPSTARTLNLPVKETPEIAWDPPSKWVDATAGSKSKDVTDSFQRAIDSGATTVYFPRGEWQFGDVRVRGAVRRIIGMESTVKTKGCRLIVEEGTEPVVAIERFDTIYAKLTIEHAARRTLLVSSMVADAIVCKQGCGELFLEDVCLGHMDIRKNAVWARQLNPEYGERPAVINDGGTFWLLGLKTEGYCTKVQAINGSRTEVFGYVLANKAENKFPMFILEDSAFSACIVEDAIRKGPFSVLVEETRKGEKKKMPGAAKGAAGSALPLFVSTP